MSFLKKKIINYIETKGWSHFSSLIQFSYKMGKLGFMTIFENRKEILKIFEYKTMAHFSLLVFKMAQFILESFWEYRIEILKFLVFFFKQFGSFFSFIVKNAFSS